MSHPHCSNCGGSGRNPGSEYLDCAAAGCTAAQDRATFNVWSSTQHAEVAELADALRFMWGWAIHVGAQFDKHPDNDMLRAEWRKQCDDAAALIRKYPRKG